MRAGHDDCVVVGRFDRFKLFKGRAFWRHRFGRDDRLVSEYHVACGKFAAVTEAHAVIKMKDDLGWRGTLNTTSKAANEIAAAIRLGERIENELVDPGGHRVGAEARVGR